MSNRQVFFVGESHIHAVQVALKKMDISPFEGADIQAHRLTKIKNGTLIGTLNFQDLLKIGETLGPDDVVVSLIGGNQHSTFSLVQHDQPFSIFQHDGTRLSENVPILPRAVVKAHFERGLRGNDAKRIKAIGKGGSHRTLHLSAPPPKEDEVHILKRFETDFVRLGLAEKGLSPAKLRQQIWELQNEVLAEILKEENITLLPPPVGTVTSGGFLKPEYYARDATHANEQYGAKILDQIQNLLQDTALMGNV